MAPKSRKHFAITRGTPVENATNRAGRPVAFEPVSGPENRRYLIGRGLIMKSFARISSSPLTSVARASPDAFSAKTFR